jgi:hypothetical protein
MRSEKNRDQQNSRHSEPTFCARYSTPHAHVKRISGGISQPKRESVLPEAAVMGATPEAPMTRFAFHGMTIILSLACAAPVSAQAAVHEPSACRLPLDTNGKPPAPTASSLPQGCETATLPWSAPVGHRQPQATDVTSASRSSIDQAVMDENARVDEAIKGVCRGC